MQKPSVWFGEKRKISGAQIEETAPTKLSSNNPSSRRTGSRGKGSPRPRFLGRVENTPANSIEAGLVAYCLMGLEERTAGLSLVGDEMR
jgi:hypothetical protein